MKRTARTQTTPAHRRRGLTLVEMLVTLAMLVIIMTVLVQVFQAATGALSAARAYQQIDDQFRRVDGLIHSDLEGVTARFTPPLDPAQNLGYFEYGENEFADVQGEDSDDYIRFTAKAPQGRPFAGRMWVPLFAGGISAAQPATITSDFAEIIYFLRNGNLYRRVLLVAPQLQSAIQRVVNNQSGGAYAYYPPVFNPNGSNVPVSWQGVNDLSARPVARGLPGGVDSIVLNTLGDLTNRENRFASPRFADDFVTITGTAGAVTFVAGADGVSDDENSDNVPDYYPSLYYHLFLSAAGATTQLVFETGYPNLSRPGVTKANPVGSVMAFPYIFPGAYSSPQILATDAYGWIHSPSPQANVPQGGATQTLLTHFDKGPLAYLQSMNHNPIDLGDNLPTPNNPPPGNVSKQTWWGFPTWRETLSPSWNDPTRQVNDATAYANFTENYGANFGQPNGLTPRPTSTVPVDNTTAAAAADLLPPMLIPSGFPANLSFALIRRTQDLFSDADGGSSAFMGGATVGQAALWSQSWEDDLIMTGVRSFDVKAYDNALGTYVDLGWGDDMRIAQQFSIYNANTYANATVPEAPYLSGNYDELTKSYVLPAYKSANGQTWNLLTQTFAHEGRIPPLINDNILDAQYPNPNYVSSTPFYLAPNIPNPLVNGYVPQYAHINFKANNVTDNINFNNYSSNIGDNNTGVVRLRRVWDSWSTEYSRAPANGVYNNPLNPNKINSPPVANPNADALNGTPWGPLGGTPPIYPSYPAPYQAPLRGIQIQLRVVDPNNQRIKSLTIRQDFTDKL